jgi:hypothetical protein
LVDGKGRKAEEAKAGDEYGDAGESGKEGTLLSFCFQVFSSRAREPEISLPASLTEMRPKLLPSLRAAGMMKMSGRICWCMDSKLKSSMTPMTLPLTPP